GDFARKRQAGARGRRCGRAQQGRRPRGPAETAVTTRFSVTELAVSARCERQMVLAREGYRIVDGDGGIGQAAHAILAGFVARGATHPLLETALTKDPLDEAALVHAAVEALYRELFDRAPSLARNVASSEMVRLARIAF